MAQFYPTLNEIFNKEVPESDRKFLSFIHELNDEFHVFYKPFLNGYAPDVVILNQRYGIFIVSISDFGNENTNHDWKSDYEEVNFFISNQTKLKHYLSHNYFVELFKRQLENSDYKHIINNIIYFKNFSTKEYEKLVLNRLNNRDKSIDKTQAISYDNLNIEYFEKLLSSVPLNKYKIDFDDALFKNLFRYLKPSYHNIELKNDISFTSEQLKVLENPNNAKQRKIRGVAGSGKTLLLSKIAVNEAIKTKDTVLILTFNITLRNYLKFHLQRLMRNGKGSFEVRNYHDFFSVKSLMHNLETKYGDFENTNYFEGVSKFTKKYKTILIDEIQDFREEWISIIRKYFWDKDGTYIVFGDEKQNIYDRVMDQKEKRPKTGVPGYHWNVLSHTYRMSNRITELAQNFQYHFFKGKYHIDNIEVATLPFDYSAIKQSETNKIIYKYYDKEINAYAIYKHITETAKKLNIHPNDVCILCSKIDFLRSIDFYFKSLNKEETTTIFEDYSQLIKMVFSKFPLIPNLNGNFSYKPLSTYLKSAKKIIKLFDDYDMLFNIIKEYYMYIENFNNDFENILKKRNIDYNEFLILLKDFEEAVHMISIGKIKLDYFDYDWEELIRIVNKKGNEKDKQLIGNISNSTNLSEFESILKKLSNQDEYKKHISDYYYIKFTVNCSKGQFDEIRKLFKTHFDMNTGHTKLSTIHSFKGWETHTLFLVIDHSDNSAANNELIYTAITRAKFNIIILNINNGIYHSFFKTQNFDVLS